MSEHTLEHVIDDHNAIMPTEPQLVTAQGEEFAITPFKFPQYAKAIKAFTKIMGILNLKERLDAIAEQAQADGKEDAEIGLSELLASLLDFDVIARVCDEGTEEIIALMMIATGKPRAWFDNLEADEGIELAGAVVGVNVSFFIQRGMSAIQRAIGRVTSNLSPVTSQPLQTSPTNGEILQFPGSTHGATQ